MAVLTNKFFIYGLDNGGFLDENAQYSTKLNSLEGAALYSEASAKKAGIDISDEQSYLLVPVTKAMADNFLFNVADTAPDVEHSDTMDREAAMSGNFIILTEYGFYDEKYNSLTNTSCPKIRGFDLTESTLYNQETLNQLDQQLDDKSYGYLLEDASGESDLTTVVVPISETQQEALKQIPEFTREHGFFMTPIGDLEENKQESVEALDKALGELENEIKTDEVTQ